VDASAWDERYRASDLVWSATPNVWVAEECAALAPGRAIDLAAGEGRNALWLAERGWQVEAVDFSPVGLDRARAMAAERGVALTTTVADVTAPMDLAPADLVVVCYLQLPHEPLARALGGAAGLTAPGGTLVVVAHERDNLERGFGGPPDPAVLPTVDDVVAALDGSGLEIARAEQVVRGVATDDGEREAIDLVVRAVRPA
jgi:SAM-dependent methyltransferase